MPVLSHGHTANGIKSSTYAIWTEMKQRCENPRNKKYSTYGARGISVCERWQSFEAFLSDMGERPPGLLIERLNNDGNYEPSNCIWADRKTQQRNRRVCKRVEYLGQEMTLFEAVKQSGTAVPYSTIYFRLVQGWELQRALQTPINCTGRPRKENPVRPRTTL